MQLHDSVYQFCKSSSLCLLIQGTNTFAISVPEPEAALNTVKYISKFIELAEQSHLLGSQKIIGLATNMGFPGLKSDKAITDLKKSLKLNIFKTDELESGVALKSINPHVLLTNPVNLDDKKSPVLVRNKKIGNKWEAFHEMADIKTDKNGLATKVILCVAENGSEEDILLDYRKCVAQIKSKYDEERGFAKISVNGQLLAVLAVENSDGLEDLEEFLDDSFEVKQYKARAEKKEPYDHLRVRNKQEFEDSKRMLVMAVIGLIIAFGIITLRDNGIFFASKHDGNE